MKRSILVKNHLAVPSVTTNAQHSQFWRDMKELILVINHSAAHSVTSNAQPQVIWDDTKEYTPTQQKAILLHKMW